jgi:F-type H+-transporting ATPase subunit b
MALMQIDPGVILWTLIIFSILVVLLGKLAWKPILRMVSERETRIRESIEKADAAKNEAARLLAEQKAFALQAREETSLMLKSAREEAAKAQSELTAKAHTEAEALLERARRQMDEESTRAVETLRKEAVDLALAAASHLLEKSMDQESHRLLVQRTIEQLPKHLERS